MWAALWLALAHLGLVVALECGWPALRDREYQAKHDQLAARLAERPGRPLLLGLGSSRTFNGLDAAGLERGLEARGQPWLVYNYGLTAAGPMRQLLCLRRLLAAGVRPRRVLVEVLPPLLNAPGFDRLCEENWLHVPTLTLAEMVWLRSYYEHPNQLSHAWLRGRWACCFVQRRRLREELLPALVPPLSAAAVERMDGSGWAETGQRGPADGVRQALAQYTRGYAGFRLGAGPTRALRDLVRLCREQGAEVVLVLMPESTEFRRACSPDMETAVGGLLTALRHEGADVLDARDWLGDEEFYDGHHLLPDGARHFTARLAQCLGREEAPTSWPTN